MKTLTVTAIILFATACSSIPVGMNIQRSTARATGDVTTTLALEYNVGKVTPAQVIETANIIKNIINSVDLTTITRAELIAMIDAKINVAVLKTWATKIVGIVPEDMNLADAKVVMVDMLDQIILAATKFDPAAVKVNRGE